MLHLGHVQRAAPPGALAERYLREERAREHERWKHVRDPRLPSVVPPWESPTRSPYGPRPRPPGWIGPWIEGVYRMVPAYEASGSSAQGSSPRTTGSVSVTSGWLIFVVAGWEDAGTIGATGISGSVHGSSGWTVDTLIDGSGPRLQAGWRISSNTGSETFTVTATSAAFMEAVVVLVSGIDTSSPFDKRTVNTGSGTAITSGVSSNYAQADTWLVFAGKLYNNGNYGTYLNSFTERFDGVGLCVAERTVASTTGLGAGCTSTVNDAWAAGQWAFKGAAAGPSPQTGDIAATIQGPTAAVNATVDVDGDLAATIPTLGAVFDGDVALVADLAATIPGLSALLDGSTLYGDFDALVPVLSAAFDGDVAITGDLAATIPVLAARLRDAAPGSPAAALRRRLMLMLDEEGG